MSILSVQNLGKYYRHYHSEMDRIFGWFGINIKPSSENWILQGVSFDVQKGESIGIVGKNGAGKSTLLKMITGTLQPTDGSVRLFGKISAILELGMGFNGDLTARQNVIHALGLQGYGYQEIMNQMQEIEDFAEIGDYFDEPLRTYSSGMQMRVAFGVATAFRPDILIVDEALSVGDAYFQAKCYEKIASFRENGTSLLLVTHSTADVVRHCDRAIYIENGSVFLDGSPKDVTNVYLSRLQTKKRIVKKDWINEIDHKASVEDVFHTRPGYRKEEHRFGDGGGKITDYLIKTQDGDYPSVLHSNELVDIYFSAVFDNDYNDITPGILIKTIDGLFLYGTNVYIITSNMCSVKKDEPVSFHFRLPIHLNSGHYLLSFGIAYGPQEALKPIDRRYDSVILNVYHETSFWGIVDLGSSFSYKVIKNG